MQKEKFEKEVFHKTRNHEPYTWKDIKAFQFEDDDIIEIGYDEGFYTENNSVDPHFFVTISRMVEETDEEFSERMKDIDLENKWAEEQQYKTFLKLKEKFEPTIND
jgi:hypothetical protein